jgi:putative transposase
LAIVLLPDHLHTIWTLPAGDSAYPLRWQKIKEEFTRRYLVAAGDEGYRSPSRRRRRDRGVWQRRYWEHNCVEEEDLKNHLDYLHWNPVKHGLVRRVSEYPWSSFHRFVTFGEYDAEWGGENPCPGFDVPEPEEWS